MYTYGHARPALTTDAAVFRQEGGALQVLLIRRGNEPFRGRWALPGGFVDVGERLEDAARRELEEETGLTGVALQQLGAFGDPDRDPREHTVSVVYYGVLAGAAPPVRGADDAVEARWFPLHRLPPLAFDHDVIVPRAAEQAASTLRSAAENG